MTHNPDGYSFILPAYNDAEGLRRHIDFFSHVPGGRDQPVQLVVVDDCSEDETPDLLAAVELPEGLRVTYRRQMRNTGPAQARNLGISLAEEERVMFLDADDLLSPCFFTVMKTVPLGVSQLDFVLFKYHLSTDRALRFTYDMHLVDRRFFTRDSSIFYPVSCYRLQDRPWALATVNFPWNKLYRRAFLQDSGIAFPDVRMHEDIPPHWASFLRSNLFGVLDWAPPLITHYEVFSERRATQYVGEKRMAVFTDLLPQVEAEVLNHSAADRLLPIYRDFCRDLFAWLSGKLCDDGGEAGRIWRPRYEDAIAAFWASSLAGEDR